MDGKDVAITQVVKNGIVGYQTDKDSDPNTVTFDASAGDGKLNPDDYPTADAYEKDVDAIYQKYGFNDQDSAIDKLGSLIWGDDE